MKKRILLYLAILITLVNLSALGAILYQRYKIAQPCESGNGFDRVKKQVKLTAVQIEQFQVYRQVFHAELDSLDRLLATERRLLAEEIRAVKPDSARIAAVVEGIGQLQQQSQYRVIEHFFQIKQILTPEQQEQFFNIVLERFVGRQQFPGLSRMRQDEMN
ncbi:MAG: Spy/CpxP family protein refolding chaperone [Candidatus Zhuqueibacterota bacterium]